MAFDLDYTTVPPTPIRGRIIHQWRGQAEGRAGAGFTAVLAWLNAHTDTHHKWCVSDLPHLVSSNHYQAMLYWEYRRLEAQGMTLLGVVRRWNKAGVPHPNAAPRWSLVNLRAVLKCKKHENPPPLAQAPKIYDWEDRLTEQQP